MLGFLVAFWATPHMTIGPKYEAYRQRVPMLVPTGTRRR